VFNNSRDSDCIPDGADDPTTADTIREAVRAVKNLE
jgi:hypothetical protein